MRTEPPKPFPQHPGRSAPAVCILVHWLLGSLGSDFPKRPSPNFLSPWGTLAHLTPPGSPCPSHPRLPHAPAPDPALQPAPKPTRTLFVPGQTDLLRCLPEAVSEPLRLPIYADVVRKQRSRKRKRQALASFRTSASSQDCLASQNCGHQDMKFYSEPFWLCQCCSF